MAIEKDTSATTPQSSHLRRDAADDLLALADTMTILRAQCPWDREQTLQSLRPYLLEEAHEVLDILDALDADGGGPLVGEHREELGDLLLQIVFQSEIQREAGRFDVGDVARAINDKLIRRHPHIFPNDLKPEDVVDAEPGSQAFWEAIKRVERARKGKVGEPVKSALDGVPRHLPALLRAYRTGEKARGAGFDWPSHHGVVDKIREELAEVEEAIEDHAASPDVDTKAAISSEIGDLLYAVCNLARHFEIDPEAALRQTIGRFEQRFRIVEDRLRAVGSTPEAESLDTLEAHWQAAKKELAARSSSKADADADAD